MTERDRKEAERLLIASLLQHATAIAVVLPFFDKAGGAEWCHGTEEKWILDCIVKYAKVQGVNQVPSRTWLMRETRQAMEGVYPAEEPDREAKVAAVCERYEDLIDRYRQIDAPAAEAKLWSTTLAQEVRDRKVYAMLQESRQFFEKGRLDDGLHFLVDQSTQLKNFLMDEPAGVSVLFDKAEVNKDLELLRMRRDDPDRFRGWYSGIHRLDAEMNGLQPGEMGAVVARTGAGKSALIRDILVHGAEQGARVLYVSAEMSKELVRWQLYSRLTGWLYNDLKFGRLTDEQMRDEFVPKLRQARERMTGEIVILDVTKNCSVATVEALIQERNLGHFDIYGWDHMGLMRSTVAPGGKSEESDWQMQLAVSNEIREFCQSTRNPKGEWGVVSWVALQEKPGASERPIEKLSATDVNRSSAVAQGMHAMVHLIRSSSAALINEAMLKLTKVRDGQDGLLVKVKTDLAHMHFLADQMDSSYDVEIEDERELGGF